MTGRQWGRIAALIGGLLVLALVLPQGLAFAQRTLDRPMVLPDDPKLAAYLRLVLGLLIVVMALATVVMSLSGPRENIFSRRARRVPPWVQIIFLLVALFIAWALAKERYRLRHAFAGLQHLMGHNRQGKPAVGFHVSHTYGVAITVLLAIAAVALLLGMWLLVRRGRVLEYDSEQLDEELTEAVLESLEKIETVGEPREAIIACYVRMQEALTAAGVTRKRSDTPFEFLARILAQRSGAGPGARTLTDLFERARFSDHEITEGMRDDAAAALHDIRNGLVEETEANV